MKKFNRTKFCPNDTITSKESIMNRLLKKLAMLIALLTFNFTNILANDTVSVSLISEGDRGLALEKLLQFKCTEVWFPNLNSYVVDKEGNIYVSVCYGDRLEMPNDELISGFGTHANSIVKFSSNFELQWHKEFYANTKEYSGVELFLVGKGLLFDDINNKLYYNLHIEKRDSTHFDTLYFDNKVLYTLDTLKSYSENILYSMDPENGEVVNSVKLDNYEASFSSVINVNDNRGGFCVMTPIDGKFDDEIFKSGPDKWSFSRFSSNLDLLWSYSVGGDRLEYLFHAIEFNEPNPQMYVFNDTIFISFPFQSDSIQINPDTNNPIYVYSSVYEMGFSGWGIQGQDAMIEKLCIANDTIKLLEYKKVGWDSVPQLIRQRQDGSIEALFYKDELNNYDTLSCYIVNPDLSMTKIEEPYVGPNSKYMHRLDKQHKKNLNYDDDFNYINNIYLYDYDWTFDFSDSIKNYSYIHESNANLFVKYKNNTDFCYSVIVPNFVYADIQNDVNNGRLFVGGSNGYAKYKDKKSALNWNPWEESPTVSCYGNDGGYLSSFLASYVETFRVKGEVNGKGKIIVPDTLVWYGKDCEIQVVPNKGYQLTSLTANGKEIMPDSDGRYYLRNVTEPICVDAQFVENSSVDDVNTLKSKISVYPNPVDDELTIKSDVAPTQMKIYDVAGRQIMMVPDGTTKIDVSSLSAGMYVLKMKVNGVEMLSEFIKK